MSIQWLYFLLIFGTSFLLYHLLPVKCRWSILLISSIAFYIIASGYKALGLTMIPILISFFAAQFIDKAENEKKKKLILLCAILLIVFEFIVLKVNGIFNIFGSFLANTFSLNQNFVNNIIIPIGLSYYSLILIAYMTDVYRKVTPIQTNFLKYSLFTLYFPQIMMGPIVRHNDVKDQLYSEKEIDFNCIKFGIFRILWGIAKKIVIADRLAAITNIVLPNYSDFSGYQIWMALVFFGLQFYFDFSAAMDIILGASECFGIKLPENFKNPLFSKSFHEYWQRWHITLNSFLRDYIFYPVIRSNVVSTLKQKLENFSNKWTITYIPFFIAYIAVWFAAGIWHGMQMKYIIANCMLPCIFMMFEDVLRPLFSKIFKNKKKSKIWIILKPLQMLYVYTFLCVCWIFFNTDSIATGLNALDRIVHEFQIKPFTECFINTEIADINLIITGIIILLAVDIIKELKIDLRKKYVNAPLLLRWGAISVMLVIIMLLGIYGPEYNPQDFIYFKF